MAHLAVEAYVLFYEKSSLQHQQGVNHVKADELTRAEEDPMRSVTKKASDTCEAIRNRVPEKASRDN